MAASTDDFCRRFGEVHQTQWIYGDGEIDLAEHMSQLTAMGAELAKSLGLEELNLDEGGFRMFRPLVPTEPVDTLLFLERYDDIRVWAAGEYEAQISPVWMKFVLDDQDNAHTRLGEGHLMVEDSLGTPRVVDSDTLAIDWVTYEPTKKAALVDFPGLVHELSEAVEAQGFDQTSVRYFAMTTIAGPGLNYAHLWLEHASPGVLGQVLAWRQSAPELADWRNRLNAICGGLRSRHLLSQVG